ncbi:hypothetical protein HDU96_004066 [Phlyctochytrium bullatum]|nr:hypothetical protein HDU96_004066 [Phlyctochytrium bullatum]
MSKHANTPVTLPLLHHHALLAFPNARAVLAKPMQAVFGIPAMPPSHPRPRFLKLFSAARFKKLEAEEGLLMALRGSGAVPWFEQFRSKEDAEGKVVRGVVMEDAGLALGRFGVRGGRNREEGDGVASRTAPRAGGGSALWTCVEVVHLLQSMLEGLDKIHRAGWMHGDVHMDNVCCRRVRNLAEGGAEESGQQENGLPTIDSLQNAVDDPSIKSNPLTATSSPPPKPLKRKRTPSPAVSPVSSRTVQAVWIDFGLAARLGTVSARVRDGLARFKAPEIRVRGSVATPAVDVFAAGRVVEWVIAANGLPLQEEDRSWLAEALGGVVEGMCREEAEKRLGLATVLQMLEEIEGRALSGSQSQR